ncbi:uncharacterized protein CANTADRAFT_4119 [Suhomyces tanzawaensis NRRL Y-17324]|uniref:ER membrane protein complex subunit 3 n=1 Tax=Suhomyces tanzawaensis NRRL Y-17324 TaxID=984487 RepID=A0A1E4SRE0_9ASCO|nr:uncharacterized protein CANTADRAFT_4119 [Suhomyces tanzawaensis NRRL Y-17324]ODV82079.1 transmembrane protein [Suhomyces tanzawaensis NRRL Y-17324]
MATPDLILDPALKYWVLLPISFVMVLVGLIRSNVTYLLSPKPKLEPYRAVREKQFLKRAQSFTQNSGVLNAREIRDRQQFLIEKLNSSDFYAKEGEEELDPLSAFADPANNEAMMNMAKGNMMNYIPQTVIMGWVNYFFAGFVIMKLPFPVTDGFKGMLQTGVATPDLNVRYVSSISWYFVNLFGLRPVYSLLMGDKEANELISQQNQQQGMPNIGGPGGPKADKLFKAEAESIQILGHESIFDGIVERVLSEN